MDPDTESLLVSTCLALGGFEDRSENLDDTSRVYVMGDECLECLKDIKKFIKYYEEAGDNVALTFLGKMGILEKDLIPIVLLNSPADNSIKERLVLACIELMVPMTWIIDYEELKKIATAEEDDSIVGNLYEKNEILRNYKKAFLQPGVLNAVFDVLLRPIQVEYRVRTTRDTAIIRLGLSLFRNLVAIRDAETSLAGSMDQFLSSIMQDQLLERFQEENVMSLLVTLASSSKDSQLAEWNAITMEIFYYIFSGVEPEELMPAVVSSTGSVRNSKLEELLQKEEREKQAQSTAGRKRHDRFGTTGEARLTDGRRMVLHQKGALFSSIEKQLDSVKKPKAKTKRQKELDDFKKTLSKSGAENLRNIALTVLESCFNPLFESIRRDIEMGRERVKPYHVSQSHVLMAFLLQFRRLYVENLIKQPRQTKKDIIEQDMKRLTEMLKTFFRHEPERLLELKTIVDAQDWGKLQHLSDSALSAHQHTVYESKKAEIMHLQEEKLLQLEEEYRKSVEAWDYDLISTAVDKATVFQIIRYIRDRVERNEKDLTSNIRKALDCFQEILVALNGMYKSPNEQYREASDNVQNNLYYEEGTLELFLDLVKGYKRQSPKYLMTLIRMNHILLKTLETYSQEKAYIAINKKHAMKIKKKKTNPAPEETDKDGALQTENPDEPVANQEQIMDGVQEGEPQQETQEQPEMQDEPNNDQNSDDEELPSHTYKEHRFVFKDFERRYANEIVLATYCAYLENFAELNDTQLRWVAAMFYRMAINCANTAVFYKASTLQLFHQILDSGLLDPKGDLVRFIYHLLRQFFKKLQEYPLLVVDVFAPKTKRICLELNIGRLEAEKTELEVSEKKEKRLMATELEVDSNRSEEEQIKIAVMALYDEDKSELVEWAVEILKNGVIQRELMTFRTESELAENPDLMHSVEGVEDIPVVANTPARQKSLRIEPRFRLLLKLIRLTRDDVGADFQFKIPKDLPTDLMVHFQEVIEAVDQDSSEESASYDFQNLIKKINKPSSSRRRGIGGSRVMAEQEAVVYHSAEYVVDSGDEDDAYFEGERELRTRKAIDFTYAEKRHREMVENNERMKVQQMKEAARVKRAALKGTSISLTDDEGNKDNSDNDTGRPSAFPSPPPPRKASVSLDSDDDDDDDSDDEITSGRYPPKSTSDVESDDGRPSQAAATPRRTTNIAAASSRRVIDLENSEDDNDSDNEQQATQPLPVASRSSTQTNKRRIILEDSDDEDDEPHTQGSPAKKKHAFEE
ncbi:Topoisomerase 1-associated factor 1 [Linnemannia schmuckeri]|uniref:Topoisomerase 1-associated factor 1 n=1 Tax=Linnemannia schmuckeri TaxID=64567 RepID=A0A9P5VDW8_9FUNG|nr:Topoisomerase 1-associated factor 1 [Linnemannia schmuckeri]